MDIQPPSARASRSIKSSRNAFDLFIYLFCHSSLSRARHENIITMIDTFEDANYVYMILE